MLALNQYEISNLLKPRQKDSHKGTYGHALLLAGDAYHMGAAILSAKACLRSGVGILTVNIPESERLVMQIGLPEAMIQFREKENNFAGFQAIGIGPGFGKDAEAKAIFQHVLETNGRPMVIDADALTILAHHPELWKKIPDMSVFTPHPKEFDRIFGDHVSDEDRLNTAKKVAKERKCIFILKSHATKIVSPDHVFVNSSGNPGLAKGGSGDILTGMITAFIAQGYDAVDAAVIGVYMHGFAADIAVKKQSYESLLGTDVIAALGEAFHEIMD